MRFFRGLSFDFPKRLCYNQSNEIRDFSVRNGFEKESAKIKGNQVEILSDPVTVSREC